MIAALASRELSAEQLVRDCLARIAQREPAVQAWEVLDGERALREARRIDAMRDRPPLCGLPVGVKDLIDTGDLPTAYGSPNWRGHRPAKDAACVHRLREAGAVILGKTVTTEFAVYTPGKTRNPRDLSRTPGGSSSGSAAAVADGMIPAALGTQTAASVIRPASFCGVIGFKPSFGLLPMDGIRPLAPSLDTLGFFVRDLQDVPPLFAALAGAPPRPMPAPPAMPRFALCRTDRWEKAEPSTRAAVEDCAARLHAFELDLGTGFAGLVDAQIAIMGAEAAISLQNEQPISARLREFLDAGRACSPERLRSARDQAERCRREFDQLAGRYDAVITPAAPGEAPIGLESTGDPAFSRIWTLLGAPSFSLPILTGPAGLPLGLQLVGGRGRDEALLAAAAWVLTTAR